MIGGATLEHEQIPGFGDDNRGIAYGDPFRVRLRCSFHRAVLVHDRRHGLPVDVGRWFDDVGH